MIIRNYAIILLLAIGTRTVAADPAQWHENDWVKFIDTIVWGSLSDAYSKAGGRFPLVDVYSALSASASATKPGLQLWLRKKMAKAYADENFAQGDRYNAFYSCLTWNSCEELKKLENAEQITNLADRKHCDDKEIASMRKGAFSEKEIDEMCSSKNAREWPAGHYRLTDGSGYIFYSNGQGAWCHMTWVPSGGWKNVASKPVGLRFDGDCKRDN